MTRLQTRRLQTALIASIVVCAPLMVAQVPSDIHFDEANKVFRIDAGGVTYAFGINNVNELQPVYWGGQLSSDDKFPATLTKPEAASFDSSATTTPNEYAGWGAGIFVEPALKVSYPDGNRDLVLHYVSHTIKGNELTIALKDIERNLFVELHYVVDHETGIVGRSAVIMNKTPTPVTIEEAAAATWNLPRGMDYSLRYLSGRWAAEWNLQKQAIRPGETVLESKRGSTGHQNNPGSRSSAGNIRMKRLATFGSARWRGVARGASAWSRTSCSRFA
jgi:alpha-galactosidase